jgi:hypothetical protein
VKRGQGIMRSVLRNTGNNSRPALLCVCGMLKRVLGRTDTGTGAERNADSLGSQGQQLA